MINVGINGFGRIGRSIFRAFLSQWNAGDQRVKIVAVNNLLKKSQTIQDIVHMLEFDSVHGRLGKLVTVGADYFEVDGLKVFFHSEMDPLQLDWSKDLVDVVIDSTGVFKDKAGLGKHLRGTVKKVIMSAPGVDLDGTFVVGVNDDQYDKNKHHIISNASCTTNCLAPIVKVLDSHFGIEKGMMNTIHSYTADQVLVDSAHDDLRRARAAALNMIPTKTGAAKAVGEVIPHLKGKIDGFAIRVPTPNVSVVDFCAILKRDVTKEEVHQVLDAAAKGPLKGILDLSHRELVSSDFNGVTFSSSIDTKYTQVMGNMVKILSWYDNEVGYSNRMLDLVKLVL